MRTDNPWKILSSEIKYKNPWMTIHEDKVITPLGGEGIYGYMESNDSVLVAVLNETNKLYLIRKFDYPSQKWDWELPGGGGDQQDPILASKRELKEETGILATDWHRLGSARVCGGLMTERATIYLAQNLLETEQKEISNEQIDEAKFFSMEQVDTMIETGDIDSAPSIAAIHLVQKWLTQNV